VPCGTCAARARANALGFTPERPIVLGQPNGDTPVLVTGAQSVGAIVRGAEQYVTGTLVDTYVDRGWIAL
jgi:hypothetical protein